MQLSKGRECKAKDAEKLLSQWEKGAKFNFKIKAQVAWKMFLFMKWNCYLQCRRQIFMWLELFCRASPVRASMHRITSLELLSTLMIVFSATKQMKRMQGQGCWKASFSERKVATSFFAEQVMLELNAQNHWFRPSKTLMLCLVH